MSRRPRPLVRSALIAAVDSVFENRNRPQPGLTAGRAGARSYGVETLECRRMLAILSSYANVTGNTANFSQGGTAFADFYEVGGGGERIAVHDATVELIGVAVPTGSAIGIETELVPASVPTAPTVIPNLYTIYVLRSSLDSWISIGSVALPSTTPTDDRPYILSGSPTFSVFDTGEPIAPMPIAAPIGTVNGTAILGAVSLATNDTVPITSVTFDPSVRTGGPYVPATGDLEPGLYMSPVAIDTTGVPITSAGLDIPNDLGRFFFAGVVTGNVDIPSPADAGITNIAPEPASQGGNVGVFYAGSLLTGSADGDPSGTGPLTDDSNFYVGGDLRDLISSGAIGGGRGAATRADESQYQTGFRAVVAGSIGEVDSRTGGVYGSVEALHNPSVYGLPNNLYTETELEAQNQVTDPASDVGDYFGPGDGGTLLSKTGVPQLPSTIYDDNLIPNQTAGVEDFTNEGDPQYLGSVKEASPSTGLPFTDASGNDVYYASVEGVVEGTVPNPEQQDVYAVPLLAGQTIVTTVTNIVGFLGVRVTDEHVSIQLIDPDGRVVATAATATGIGGTSTPFEYTADRPGIYSVAINEAGASVTDDEYYLLTVQGVGDMGLGEIVAGGNGAVGPTDIYGGDTANAFEVDHGDLGALIAPAGASIASDAADQAAMQTGAEANSVVVASGSLREVKGGQIGVSVSDGPGVAAPISPYGATNSFGASPDLDVPAGQIGLLEALDLNGYLAVVTPFDPHYAANDSRFISPAIPVGGNIQVVDGLGSVFLDVATNQGIGTIDAGNMATPIPSFLDVNADDAGNDGIIGLINTAGDLGTLAAGGPGIVTHTGGYVRYLRVGGAIYQDSFFGGGFPTSTMYQAGTSPTYTDDTGAQLVFTPVGPTSTITYNNGLTTSTETSGPQVQLTTYGIRDKGGGVIVAATALNGSLSITSKGGGEAANGEADISLITVVGSSVNTIAAGTTPDANGILPLTVTAGTPIESAGIPLADGTSTFTGTDTVTGLAATGTQVISGVSKTSSITISGSGAVDVLQIIDTAGTIDVPDVVTSTSTSSTSFSSVTTLGFTAVTVSGNLDSIVNNSPGGEIAAISATGSVTSIISRGTIGLIGSSTAAAVVLANSPTEAATGTTGGRAPTVNAFAEGQTFPFDLQTTGISIAGNVVSIRANAGVGNINVAESIGSIIADYGGAQVAGQFAGINAPVTAGPLDVAAVTSLVINGQELSQDFNIDSVQIGQGVLPSGDGSFSRAGIYANGDLGFVGNSNRAQSDIRGNIVAEQRINRIALGNGSIIDANIFVTDSALSSTQGRGSLLFVGLTPNAVNAPEYEIGRITITGRGGILGTAIAGQDIGPVNVAAQGFGILNSSFDAGGDGVIGAVTAGGYGIRSVTFTGGAEIISLNASGNGSQLPVTAFGVDLRPSDTGMTYDSYSGELLTAANDLNAFLGTSQSTPIITSTTDTGVLQDVDARVSATIGTVNAQEIRASEPLVTAGQTEPAANIPVAGQTFPMELNAAGSIGSIIVRGAIDGLLVTTGSLGTFRQGASVSRLGIAVAGTIRNLTIHGNFGQQITNPATDTLEPDSFITATGAQGTIDSLTIDGNLNGTVTANVAIEKMTVLGNVVGSISALGQSRGQTLGTLRIGGALQDGSLTIDGPAGSIITNAGLGDSTGTLTVDGSLQSLQVGAAHARGSTLASAVHIMGTLGKLIVNGSITGAVVVDGDLTSLRVTGDGSTPNAISAPITVGGRLYTATIADGNVAADITANGFIRSFTVTDGDVLASSTITSQLDAIQNFRITGGTGFGLFGNLSAVNGAGGSIDISGNFGDGTDAASIMEGTGKQFHIRGSILSNTDITLSGGLDLLEVDGNIAAGAVVTAHPLSKLTVRGTNAGTITQT